MDDAACSTTFDALRPSAVLIEMGDAGVGPADAARPSRVTGRRVANARAALAALGCADRRHNHDAWIPERAAQRSADSPRLLREINDQRGARAAARESGPMTRGRIGEQTGLSKPTVSSLLARLDERGLVTTTGVVEGGPGRTRGSTR